MYTKEQCENMLITVNKIIKEHGENDFRNGEKIILSIILE